MKSSSPVAKTVARNLKYYFDVKRLEDGFDLSSSNAPKLDHPPLKARPALQYDGLHDRPLKHYFSQPEVRVQLTQLGLDDSQPRTSREHHIKRSLTKDMKKHNFLLTAPELPPAPTQSNSKYSRKSINVKKKATIPDCYYVYSSPGLKNRPSSVGFGSAPKTQKQKSLKGGWPVIRSVPPANITGGEAERMVNSASKLLASTTDWDLIPRLDATLGVSQHDRACTKKYERKLQSASGKRRPLTAKYTWDQNGHRLPSAVVKAYDDSYLDKVPMLTYLKRPPSPPRKKATQKSSHAPSKHSSPSRTMISMERQSSARGRQRTDARLPPQQIWQEKQSARSYPDSEAGISESDDMGGEVKEGPKGEYQVFVRTSDYIGASTTAAINLTIIGEKGRTPPIHLASSKYNKVKFQRGKEDLFIVTAHHVGKIGKITIGHDRPQLSYAWHLDKVTIRDMLDRKVYNIPCGQWLSGQDEDQQMTRSLPVLSHQNLKADKSKTRPSSQSQRRWAESSFVNTESNSTPHRRSQADSTPGLQSVKSPHSTTSVSDSEDDHEVPTYTLDLGTPKSAGQEKKGDTKNQRSPTVYTESQKKDSQRGKESRARETVNARGKDQQPQPVIHEYLAGYKAGLEAAEASERKRREEERLQDQQLLAGPSIHDACRKGDLERVKVLMDKFPEMKDLRDENGWSPLHLAAGAGHVDIIKRVSSAGCDNLDVETPTGYTPSHVAAMNGHISAVMVLSAMGADIGCKTVDQQSSLHLAARAGHLECVQWLMANGAELKEEDSYGRTPYDLADEYGQTAIVHFLEKCERDLADPNSTMAQMYRLHQRGGSVATQAFEDDKGNSDSGYTQTNSHRLDRRAKDKQDLQLQEKRQMYELQHRHMDEEGVSFLDSIRHDFDREAD